MCKMHGNYLKIRTRKLLGSHINKLISVSAESDKVRIFHLPQPKSLEHRRKMKIVLKTEVRVKQRRRRDLNPVLGTRSANHQHLLLFFFFKLGKGQKAKPEKTKFCFLRKRKTFATLLESTGESASAKMLAWPSLLCSPEKVLAESVCNPTRQASSKTKCQSSAYKALSHPHQLSTLLLSTHWFQCLNPWIMGLQT